MHKKSEDKIKFLQILMASSVLFSPITYAEIKLTAGAISQEIQPFHDLTKNLFVEHQDHTDWMSSQIPEVEIKAANGGKYLYCAILADYLANTKDAPKLYDKGMNLLDSYALDHSIRDASAYDTLKHRTSFTNSIPNFHQSWLVNNKDTLKGMIFERMYQIISDKYYSNQLNNNNISQKEFSTIYKKNCTPLV